MAGEYLFMRVVCLIFAFIIERSTPLLKAGKSVMKVVDSVMTRILFLDLPFRW